jgi:hypothetical protein
MNARHYNQNRTSLLFMVLTLASWSLFSVSHSLFHLHPHPSRFPTPISLPNSSLCHCRYSVRILPSLATIACTHSFAQLSLNINHHSSILQLSAIPSTFAIFSALSASVRHCAGTVFGHTIALPPTSLPSCLKQLPTVPKCEVLVIFLPWPKKPL